MAKKVVEVEQPDKCSDVALDTAWCARKQAYCYARRSSGHGGKCCYISRMNNARLFAKYGGYDVKAKEAE